MPYGYLIAATVITFGVCQVRSSIASLFYTDKCVVQSAIAELLVEI